MRNGLLNMRSCFYAVLAVVILMVCAVGCDTSDGKTEEFPDWKNTNLRFFQSLSDSVEKGQKDKRWTRMLTWTKTDSSATKQVTDYIIVQKLQIGTSEGKCPLYTDSVKVQYLGRLLPSTSYPKGLIFDKTGSDEELNPETFTNRKFLVSSLTAGFSTALQNMHKGDWWRIYVPHTLGYGETAGNSIPAYSVLIFDIRLTDFWH